MRYRIIPILIIALFISSSFSVIASLEERNIDAMEVESIVSFSEKTITSRGEYVSVKFDNTDKLITAPGKPMLPVYTEIFTFPLGTKINSVECVVSSDITQEVITGIIEPAPRPVPIVLMNYEEEVKEAMNSISTISFSERPIRSKIDELSGDFENIDNLIETVEQPLLSNYIETIASSIDIKIDSLEHVIPSIKQEEDIPEIIEPESRQIPLDLLSYQDENSFEEEALKDISVYESANLYPESWYNYKITCGRKGDEQLIFVTVSCYPIRYSPLENTIHTVNSLDIKINYEKPIMPIKTADEYDLVIIAPRRFTIALVPLIMHKNRYGMDTMLKTTESIYRQYNGRDKPEEIKLFIKDAIENLGVKYVLLMGGLKFQGPQWHVPPRHSRLFAWAQWDEFHLTDLYYQDVYKYNESSGEYEFEDWDSNGNNVFAEWNQSGETKDILDLNPDVYIGRLACRNTIEVRNMVRKIIYYERNTYGQEWFKRFILCGGDTFWNPYSPYFEGEIETNLTASYLEPLGFEITRLWTSLGTLSHGNVTKEFNQGCGFVHFTGHGSPLSWSTHPPQNGSWLDILLTNEMKYLRGGFKVPVVMVGGCHNSLFEVNQLNFIRGLLEEGYEYFNKSKDAFGSFYKYEWYPMCWSWGMVRQRNGGSIATIGNTGFGYGTGGQGCTESVGGYIETRFFKHYAELSQESDNVFLGQVHSDTITDYITHFADDMNRDRVDRKTVEQWALLGDPSLNIGGYPN